MKKILTLFTMLLVTVSILTAQTPKLNYQMIVRNQKATDVTIGGKVFHENDLVYSTTVTGTLKVLNGTNSAAVYEQNFAEATNMNGMLTIILDNTNTQNTRLEKIDWAHSKLCVIISNLGINDTTEILPVPYAFKAYTEDVITTPRIVSYLENLTKDSLALIVNTTKANAALLNAMRDTVASVIRNNPNKVKELTLYFLEKVTPADVNRAFNTVDDGVYQWFADYAKSHRSEAYQVVEYYLTHATLNDVKRLWNAAMSSDDADSIIYMVVDSVNKYVAEHPEWLKKTVKYAADHVTTAQISNTQNYIKTHNPDVYNAMKDILDSLIEANLKANKIVSGKCGDDVITLCQLQEQIDQLREYGFTRCPQFGTTNINSDYQAVTPIASNVDNIAIDPSVFSYEISFPGTAYPTVFEPAIYHAPSTQYPNGSIEANLSPYNNGRTISVRPRTKQACMDTATYGQPVIVSCDQECECPTFASIRQSGDSRDSLAEYHGVAVFAKLYSNYDGKLASNNGYGFEVSTDGVTYEPAGEAHFLNDGLTFTTTLGMKYCGQTLKVRAYALCVDQTSPTVSPEIECTFREVRVYITADHDSIYNGVDTVLLTAKNVFKVSGNYCGTGNEPSIEQLIACAESQSTEQFNMPTYEWTMPTGDNTTASTTNTQKAAPDAALAQGIETVKYKVKCSFSLFGEGPEYTCNLYDSIEIQIAPAAPTSACPATVTDGSGNVYNVKEYTYTNNNETTSMCWMTENLRTTKDSTGNDINQGYYKVKNNGYYYSSPVVIGKACPKGWIMPTDADWDNLKNAVNQNYTSNSTITQALASKSGWQSSGVEGTPGYNADMNNASGFNASPNGLISSISNNNLSFAGVYACYWTSSVSNVYDGSYTEFYISYNSTETFNSDIPVTRLLPVRCVKKQ